MIATASNIPINANSANPLPHTNNNNGEGITMAAIAWPGANANKAIHA